MWDRELAEKTYNVEKWSEGYFKILDNGNLAATPFTEQRDKQIDINAIIDEMKTQNITFPAVIRFHDILRNQVVSLNETFDKTIKEADYKGEFHGVYPIKVNQMREVVDEIVSAGSEYNFGLEAGSKTELLSVLAMNNNPKSLTVLNGYKDEEYIKLALLGNKIGKNVVIVVEKLSELFTILKVSKETGTRPLIGIRTKMMSVNRGKWSESSGEKSKFGLTMTEVLNAISLLKSEGYIDCVKLLHFHVGSQINDIRAIKEAITEGARVYAKLCQLDVPLEYMDVGGGLAIDYDGSQSTKHSSKNYNLSEYAADVVYGIGQICDLENVPHPNIVTESGRAITAHHSCIITDVIGEVKAAQTDFDTSKVKGEHHIVTNMRDCFDDLTSENIQESYNDASEQKEMSLNAFKLGILSLEERAKIETLYWRIIEKIVEIMNSSEDLFIPKEMLELKKGTTSQYLCNFSVFQSAADSWAIDQVLPIVPINRLNEAPTKRCTIADITCDSDGKIDKFIGPNNTKNTLPLHSLRGDEKYYLGIFLTGAYQDVMGDNHNMFGRLNEVHVYYDHNDESKFYIEESIKGTTSESILKTMQYNPEHMAHVVKKNIDKRVKSGEIASREGVKLTDFYENCLNGYTYLNQ